MMGGINKSFGSEKSFRETSLWHLLTTPSKEPAYTLTVWLVEAAATRGAPLLCNRDRRMCRDIVC